MPDDIIQAAIEETVAEGRAELRRRRTLQLVAVAIGIILAAGLLW